ncbi:MAG: hypothetical protein MUP58_00790 [Candidatus Nanohaloarchaeota archaeon QJJ-9]|nr:hypothetical protein [Candidatus Nanohaloarchaeota archaeon QJJ-9]
MKTANNLNIEKKGEVEAEKKGLEETKKLEWGRVDDEEAGSYQNTLGVKDGEYKDRGEDDKGSFFLYEVEGEEYKVYKDDINPD